MRIYVGNLNYRLRTEELKEAFEPYGEVVGAKIVRDRETKRSKGFGFVEMSNDEHARIAIETLNGFDLNGRNLVVNEAKPRPEEGEIQRSGESSQNETATSSGSDSE